MPKGLQAFPGVQGYPVQLPVSFQRGLKIPGRTCKFRGDNLFFLAVYGNFPQNVSRQNPFRESQGLSAFNFDLYIFHKLEGFFPFAPKQRKGIRLPAV